MVVNIAMQVFVLKMLPSVRSSVSMTMAVRWLPTETCHLAFPAICMIITRNQLKPVIVFSSLRSAQEVGDIFSVVAAVRWVFFAIIIG